MGRLVEEQKRVSDVAAALCEVARRIPNLEAWIVGEGEARNAVERIIEQNDMGARVRLLGRVDNGSIYETLLQCHGLVLLSDYEGLPVSMLEAMVAGVVPICLDIRSGIRETIQHGVNGLIVKDRGEEFFAAVKALQGNLAKWQKIFVAARKTARQCHSIENCALQWVKLLKRLNLAHATMKIFKSPLMLQLPPRNPKFGHHDTRLQWRRRLKDFTRTNVPGIHKALKFVISTGR